MIPYDDLDLYAIEIKLNYPHDTNDEHIRLSINADAYQTWLERWSATLPEHCDGYPMPEVPEDVLTAATHVGLILENLSERLRRELIRAGKEHDEDGDGGKCGRGSTSAAEPWDLRYDWDEAMSTRQRAEKQFQDTRNRLKTVTDQLARDGSAQWRERLEGEQADLRAQLKDGKETISKLNDQCAALRDAVPANLQLSRTTGVWASVPGDEARLWQFRARKWLAEAEKELA